MRHELLFTPDDPLAGAGALGSEVVVSVIASGSVTPARSASWNQRLNMTIGAGSNSDADIPSVTY